MQLAGHTDSSQVPEIGHVLTGKQHSLAGERPALVQRSIDATQGHWAEAGSGVAAGRNRGLQLEQSDSDEAAVVLGRGRQIADGKLSGPWKRHAGLLAPENGIPVEVGER